MWYKPYGSSGKSVSAIGFGGMRFNKKDPAAATPEYDLDACAEVVLAGRRLGINYFDTAPFYCDDQSETIMGHSFRQMKAEGLGMPGTPGSLDQLPLYVSTKSSEKAGDKLRAQLEKSLTRLGVPQITFFNIWCIIDMADFQSRMVKGGAYEAAIKAKQEGLIEHVVFSTHCNGAEIATIVGEGLFDGVTLGYNILNFRFRRQGLVAAHQRGMGVVIMNPLAGGVIPQRAAKLDFLRGPHDPSVVEAAIRFDACHPEITVVLPGMGTLAEVRQNCAVGASLGQALADGTETPVSLAAFASRRQIELETHLGDALDTLCTGCQYCLPCQVDINIPKYMLSYNENIFGKPADALNMMKWHWGGLTAGPAATCIGCGICEERCTQHLPIISRLKEIVAWEDEAKQVAAAAM